MGLKEQICRDYLGFDGVFYGTVTTKSPRRDDVECENVAMLRGSLTRSDSRSFGNVIFEPGDIAVEVWDYREDVDSQTVQTVLGREIEAGDTLTFPNEQVWVIRQSIYDDLTSRWTCTCFLGPRE